jgi:hypothetical protein
MGNHNFYPNPKNNPYRVKYQSNERTNEVNFNSTRIDFNSNRICPSCGMIISLKHNFCKFCGVDLSGLRPMQDADRTMQELAKTALTDPNADVRKEAVDTIGDFGEYEVLGVLAYILLNDPDESVRKQAAEELGDLHHVISLDVLAKALKDRSPIVRKEAIEGLKKIKEKNKPEKRTEEKESKAVKREIEEEMEEKKLEVKQEDAVQKIEEEKEEEESEEEPLKEIESEDGDYYKL